MKQNNGEKMRTFFNEKTFSIVFETHYAHIITYFGRSREIEPKINSVQCYILCSVYKSHEEKTKINTN